MGDYVERKLLYGLFPPSGIQRLHVADIDLIPSADVRPVVYCRDCMYAPAGDDDGNCLEWPRDDWPDRNPCPLKCEDNWHSHKPAPDFYCANGRRKRNE
jgi:hypothetical protein